MPTISRLTGRFFSVLILLTLAMLLPPASAFGEAGLQPPPASPPMASNFLTAPPPAALSPHFLAWPAARRFTLPALAHGPELLAQAVTSHLQPSPSPKGAISIAQGPKNQSAPAPTLCQIADTVYRADGTPAQGTALISWPAFTTAAGQAVASGSLTVTLDPSGGFNASLAPNTGASPVGTYYRAIFKLDDGTTDSEYWVVPNAPNTTIGAIRSKLVPANQAAQFLTRDFADSSYVALASTQTITGVKTFSNSPAVPAPQNPTDAANKAYVDANSSGNLASPPPIGSTAPNTGNFTTLTDQNDNGVPNAANFPQSDVCARINAAVATLPSTGGKVNATGLGAQSCSVTLTLGAATDLQLQGTQLLLGGCPGLSVVGPGAWIEGGSETTAGYAAGSSSTILKSNAACPLVQQVVTRTDGLKITDLEMDGNGVGTFGVFSLISGDGSFINLKAHDFTVNNIFAIGGLNKMHNGFYQRAGCDGIVWGSDGTIDGKMESTYNRCDGLHLLPQLFPHSRRRVVLKPIAKPM
jgi:hypothetical protein